MRQVRDNNLEGRDRLISVLIIEHPPMTSPEGAQHQLAHLQAPIYGQDMNILAATTGRGDTNRESNRIIRAVWGVEG